MDDAARQDNPFAAPASLRGGPWSGSRRTERTILVGTAVGLVLIVAPLISTLLVRYVIPWFVPRTLTSGYRWAWTLLWMSGSVAPCLVAGILLGNKRVRPFTRAVAVGGLFFVSLPLFLAQAANVDPGGSSGWPYFLGNTSFFVQQALCVAGPLAFIVCGILGARLARIGTINRRRRNRQRERTASE